MARRETYRYEYNTHFLRCLNNHLLEPVAAESQIDSDFSDLLRSHSTLMVKSLFTLVANIWTEESRLFSDFVSDNNCQVKEMITAQVKEMNATVLTWYPCTLM